MSTAEDFLHSPADEQHLACLLLSTTGAALLPDALDQVDPEDFYDTHFGELWRTGRQLVAAGKRVSKRALLADHDNPARRARVDRISGEPVWPAKIPQAVRVITDQARMRRLVQAADRITEYAVHAEDYSVAHDFAAQQIAALSGSETPREVITWDQAADDWFEALRTAETAARVIPTPWPEVDDLLAGGLHAGRSYVVAGRPGSGKSLVGLNVAQYAAESGHQALVFSVEMGSLEVTGRLMAAGARTEYGEIVRRQLAAETDRRVREYRDTYRGMPLRLVDRANVTIEYIQSVARTQKRQHGLDVLVVDYLQLLNPSDTGLIREQQVAHISRSIKQLSRELDCVVVTAAQLNRGNAKDSRKPSLADLRESGSLEQDADVVLLLHHELVDDQPTGDVLMVVAKNRTGRTGEISLMWRGYQARIGA